MGSDPFPEGVSLLDDRALLLSPVAEADCKSLSDVINFDVEADTMNNVHTFFEK